MYIAINNVHDGPYQIFTSVSFKYNHIISKMTDDLERSVTIKYTNNNCDLIKHYWERGILDLTM